MTKFNKIVLIVIFLNFILNSDLLSKDQIIVVHSYEKSFGWVNEVSRGINTYANGKSYFEIKPINLGKNALFKSFYMDAKTHQKDPDYLRSKGESLIQTITTLKPKVVLISDDEALEYVAKNLVCKSDTKFVFLGINKSLDSYDIIKNYEKPECNITGLVSEIPFNYSIKLASKIVGNIDNIFVFFDDSNSGSGILRNFKEHISKLDDTNLKSKIKNILVSNDFELWKSEILKNQKKKNLFIFGTHYTLRDKNNNPISAKEVAKWVFNNSKVPDLVVTTSDVSNGFLVSISNPGFVHGYIAMDYAAKILKGTPISSLHVNTPNQKAIHINNERAKSLGILIPVEILALANLYEHLGY